jgi:8-oxo-dGTP pyrophosphatase MutT (NUDIX family)
MPREISAGGLVVRERDGEFDLAVIKPRGRTVWALPKGHVDKGETPEQTAQREVLEETGIKARLEAPLGDVHYVYQFGGQKIFKQVHFFLFRYQEGEIDQLDKRMRIEVEEARWVPLAEATKTLAYRGEKEMAAKAVAYLQGNRAASSG